MFSGTSEVKHGWIGLVSLGVSIPFDSIRSPGAYVCNWNGHLLRVPEIALVPNGEDRDSACVIDFKQGNVARCAKRDDQFPQERVARINFPVAEW